MEGDDDDADGHEGPLGKDEHGHHPLGRRWPVGHDDPNFKDHDDPNLKDHDDPNFKDHDDHLQVLEEPGT